MKTDFKNIEDFKNSLVNDADLQQAFKDDPKQAASDIKQTPLEFDVWVYRVVVIALGTSILTIVLGIIILMGTKDINDGKIPAILTAIGSAAIGALAGLLAPSPKAKQ